MRILMWFRRDLRLRDNTALYHAARDADRGVVATYLITPGQWRKHDDSPRKIDFWLRNLKSLRKGLDDRNIPLVIEEADTFLDLPVVLLRVAKRCACDAVYFGCEYEINERRRDELVANTLQREGLRVRSFTDRVILCPGDVRTQAEKFYTVFTPFRKRWLSIVKDRGIDVLPMPRRQDPLNIESSEVPGRVREIDSSDISPERWPAGEQHARSRLEAFIRDRVSEYHEQRDAPAVNGTSTLSPYLSAGVTSPRQCLQAALNANDARLDSGQPGVRQWISELIWREFYQHIMVGFPRVCMHRPFRLETAKIPWQKSADHFQAWCEGRTGYPIVDAAMRQLHETGWMHNRLRMIVAMFFTKDLFLDWRRGERYFMQHLVDGDLGANNGGWQWSASTGTDAAPYFRIFNPITQSRKYDPKGTFLRRYLPELAKLDDKAIHDPSGLSPEARQKLGYPDPIVDHDKARQHAIEAFKALRK